MITAPAQTADMMLARLPALVRTKRLSEGLSERVAASRIGVARSTLRDIEDGKADPVLSVTRLLLQWLSPPPVIEIELTDKLTPAAEHLLNVLRERDGLGQPWLLFAGGLRGLIVPDAAGTLGELVLHARYTQATVNEVLHRWVTLGTIAKAPKYRGPRNRDRRSLAWPIHLIREVTP